MNLDHALGVRPQAMVCAGWQDHERSGSRTERLRAARVGLVAKCHAQFARHDRDDLIGRMRMGRYFVPGR